jgi:benzodiazapine receptor
MKPQAKINAVRWFVLVIVILNIIFNYTYEYLLPNALSLKEVSRMYTTMFAPAGYVFSIWGLIYISFLVYACWQLLPSTREYAIYDLLASPMIAVNLLGMMWIVAFTMEYMIPSVCIILCMLITGGMLFSIVSVKHNQYSIWLKFPFRIFLGWISVATIANIASCLVYEGWPGWGIDEPHWTVIMLIISCVIGLGVSYKFKDLVFPVVIAWACTGIGVINISRDRMVTNTAFIISALLLVWVINSIIVYYVSHKNVMGRSEGKIPQTAA